MNKNNAGVIVYILLVLFAGVLIAEYFTATRDKIWIGEVENYIKEENWGPESEFIPKVDWTFFIYENGERQSFYLMSQKEFFSYISSVMNGINRQVKESISEELLDEILVTDKVLGFVTREFGDNFDYNNVYFVLKDKLETDLEGTIIVREQIIGEDYRYSVWEIITGFL